nr:uncharacterized protein LOC123768365 [Procambarus clarkii]
MTYFKNILMHRQKQSSLDKFLLRNAFSECNEGNRKRQKRERTSEAQLPEVLMLGNSPAKEHLSSSASLVSTYAINSPKYRPRHPRRPRKKTDVTGKRQRSVKVIIINTLTNTGSPDNSINKNSMICSSSALLNCPKNKKVKTVQV